MESETGAETSGYLCHGTAFDWRGMEVFVYTVPVSGKILETGKLLLQCQKDLDPCPEHGKNTYPGGTDRCQEEIFGNSPVNNLPFSAVLRYNRRK